MDSDLCDLLNGAPTRNLLETLDYLHARRRVRAIIEEERERARSFNNEKAKTLSLPPVAKK